MHVVLGASGHVGGAVANALLDSGERVVAVVRDPARGAALRARGATVAVVEDVRELDALRAALRQGRRLFVLNPPAAPSTDTDAEESATVRALLAALESVGLERVVAQSTYGAQAGRGIGDLGTLFALEEGLRAQPIPAVILRAAFYMSNWDASLGTAEKEGVVRTPFPADFRLPMAAPKDLGRAAARLLMAEAPAPSPHYVEGPARYTPADAAAAFAKSLGRPVAVAATPPEQWEESLRSAGFSAAAARSYAGMTRLAMTIDPPPADMVERGGVTLDEYVERLVRRSASA